MTESKQVGLSEEASDLFARGLYYLADVDGIEAKEEQLIREFISESNASVSWDELKGSSFSATEAAMVLETSFHRRMFVRAAIALVKADGKFSDAERHAVGELADAFGMNNAEFGDLEQSASRTSLE